MRPIAFSILVLLLCLTARADEKHPRPQILGIAGVHFYSTNVKATRDFYAHVLGPEAFSDGCLWCEGMPFKGKTESPEIAHEFPATARVGLEQQVMLSDLPKNAAPDLLAEISFLTSDLGELENFLKASGVPFAERKTHRKSGNGVLLSVLVDDPEGHKVSFVGPERVFTMPSASGDSGWAPQNPLYLMRIIHAGFVVRDRAAEDKFYKDILGFHVYWHGGMKEGEDNWVDMQVPDGTDWIEYMLRVSPDASHKTLGVMNHIALGVPDIQAAKEQLIKNGFKPTEEPKIGRDGKWQLNLYDPDETRVELMEFKPTKEPCCSPYTGPHPGPPQ